MNDWISILVALPWRKMLESLSYLVTVLGVPWALWIYVRDVRRQREEREVGTYSSLDDKYLHYLELCIQHPDLNLFVLPIRDHDDYTAEQKVQRYALFETLISIAERAYLRYHGHASDKLRDQWTGWVGYLSEWKAHPDFANLWHVVGRQFDGEFQQFINGLAPAEKPALVTSSKTANGTAAATRMG